MACCVPVAAPMNNLQFEHLAGLCVVARLLFAIPQESDGTSLLIAAILQALNQMDMRMSNFEQAGPSWDKPCFLSAASWMQALRGLKAEINGAKQDRMQIAWAVGATVDS